MKLSLLLFIRDLNEALRQPAIAEYPCTKFTIHKACCTAALMLYMYTHTRVLGSNQWIRHKEGRKSDLLKRNFNLHYLLQRTQTTTTCSTWYAYYVMSIYRSLGSAANDNHALRAWFDIKKWGLMIKWLHIKPVLAMLIWCRHQSLWLGSRYWISTVWSCQLNCIVYYQDFVIME